MRTWDFLLAAGIFRLRLGSMEFGFWGLRRVGREGDAFLVPGGQREVVGAALLVLLAVQLRQQRLHRVGVALGDEHGLPDKQLKEGQYIVLTLNRKAIINNSEEMRSLVSAVVSSAHEAGVPVVATLRGKARQEVEAMGLEGIMLIEAQGYLDFSYLTAHAMGIVTDSGNVAEEATFNGVPCITLNSYTEHIETVKIGTNVLVGEDADRLVLMTKVLLRGEWKKAGIPDRWDGRSADRIVQILVNE